MRRADKFFAYCRERYQIHLRRSAGLPEPWTDDRILRTGRFCNVFREDDRTTRWFREHVRDPLRDRPEVLLATVVFRMFNRISSGEAIFCKTDLVGDCLGPRRGSVLGEGFPTPFDMFLDDGNVAHLRRALLAHCGRGPYVTGAYIISIPPGYSKLDGVLEILRRFYVRSGGPSCRPNFVSLQHAWDRLSEYDYLGKFHSYEIVTDLRHTTLLGRVTDVDAWANPGPGARRGYCRVLGLRDYADKRHSREDLILGMQDLLKLSREARVWPAEWPRWELREVEHSLCEFDKYERVRLGQGSLKGKFR